MGENRQLMEEKYNELNNCLGETYKTVGDTEALIYNEEVGKQNLKMIKKEYGKRITSLALALSLVTGGAVGIGLFGKKLNDIDGYYKATTVVSSNDNEEYTLKDKNRYEEPIDDKVIAIIAPKESDEKDYSYQVHNITSMQYETAEGYYDYALRAFNVDLEKADLTIKMEQYKEVVSSNMAKALTLIMYAFYILFLTLLEGASLGKFDNDSCGFLGYVNPKKIKELIELASKEKTDLGKNHLEMNRLCDKLARELMKNAELRKEFNRLYEENKQLLDNPEEMLKTIKRNTGWVESSRATIKVRKMLKDR